jgi:hypothetical protein
MTAIGPVNLNSPVDHETQFMSRSFGSLPDASRPHPLPPFLGRLPFLRTLLPSPAI